MSIDLNSPAGVVIYGPAGCGKSTHAATLARHYGKERIVDDWTPGSPVRADTLVLTNVPHGDAIDFLDATRDAGIRLDPSVARALGAHRRLA